MIVRFLNQLSQRSLDDPARRIDRTLDDRGHRLIAGLAVSPTFDQIDAVLMVAAGHGKYLRVRHLEGMAQAVPTALQAAAKEIASVAQPTVADVRQVSMDLALIQAGLFEQLKSKAGKYVDRILAIAVRDSGVSWSDFDGSRQHVGLCDPVRLAELTGVSVIDDFPSRDVAAGGTGRRLDALPLWLLHADRSADVAADHRLVLRMTNEATGYWLPASDGLDSEVPKIRALGPTPSETFLSGLLTAGGRLHEIGAPSPADHQRHSLQEMYAQGSRSPELVDQWNRCWLDHCQPSPEKSELDSVTCDLDAKLVQLIDQPCFHSLPLADVLRSAVYWLSELVLAEVSPARTRADQVLFATSGPLTHCLVNQFIQVNQFEEDRVQAIESLAPSLQPTSTDAIVSAILGLLHVDQMPANIPSLTGASEQRILGRLSPGKPSSWRQLLREMADFHPPAMKLRDAV